MTRTYTTSADLAAAIRDYLDVPAEGVAFIDEVIGDIVAEVNRYELVEADELRAMAMRAEELIGERMSLA